MTSQFRPDAFKASKTITTEDYYHVPNLSFDVLWWTPKVTLWHSPQNWSHGRRQLFNYVF